MEKTNTTQKTRSSAAAQSIDFQLAVARSSDQVIITDPDGMILYVNETTERLTGRRRTELIGKNIEDFQFWGSYQPGHFSEELRRQVQGAKKEFRAEVTNRRQDGSRYITELRVWPVLDSDQRLKFFIGSEKNITQEKDLDNTKTDFISLASHQLRTPLTNMSLSIEVLLRDPTGHLSEYQKDCLKGVHSEIHKMADLIATLLDVSKIQLGSFVVERKQTDIIQAAETALTKVMPEIIDKDLKLIKSFDSSIPRVMSDKNIVLIVLENLLSNAAKYTPSKGLVALSIKKQAEQILIAVRDNGCGIPVGEQGKIFSKFFRAGNAKSSEAQGAGLGLYMCRLLLKSVDGSIWFESGEKQGTTFYVSLPLPKAEPRQL